MTLLDYYIFAQRDPVPDTGPWRAYWRNRTYEKAPYNAPTPQPN